MSKLFSFVTASSILALSLVAGPTPVAALALDGGHSNVARHHAIAAASRRRNLTRRCKPRNPEPEAPVQAAAAAPEPSPAAAAAPAPATGGATGNNADQGEFSQLGYPFTMSTDLMSAYTQGKPTLYYNWRDSPDKDVPGWEFMPMVWGRDSVGAFRAATDARVPKFALGPNEPELINNLGLSSGMSTDEVVEVYWEVLEPLRQKGVAILTPAVTSGQLGFEWMEEFMDKCKGCQFAGQALHWYDITADSAIAHFNMHHDRFNLPIYCTEIAFNNFNNGPQLSVDEATTEMGKFNEWVKTGGSAFMKVVMYFGFQHDMVNVSPALQLIDPATGLPNALGNSVINSLKQ